MKAVVQRVSRAQVLVAGELVGQVQRGMLILLGVMRGDQLAQAERLAGRIAHFRFFPDEQGRMNRAALDMGYGALVVSQFTLAADGRKGRRPSFDQAAAPADAQPLYQAFVAELQRLGIESETGRFGAMMSVEMLCDGPVTFVLDEPAGL